MAYLLNAVYYKLMEVQSAKVGLKINATKTSVSVLGGPIEEVDEFIYLGSIVSKKGGTDEDIQARIGKARQAFAMLSNVEQVISDGCRAITILFSRK